MRTYPKEGVRVTCPTCKYSSFVSLIDSASCSHCNMNLDDIKMSVVVDLFEGLLDDGSGLRILNRNW